MRQAGARFIHSATHARVLRWKQGRDWEIPPTGITVGTSREDEVLVNTEYSRKSTDATGKSKGGDFLVTDLTTVLQDIAPEKVALIVMDGTDDVGDVSTHSGVNSWPFRYRACEQPLLACLRAHLREGLNHLKKKTVSITEIR